MMEVQTNPNMVGEHAPDMMEFGGILNVYNMEVNALSQGPEPRVHTCPHIDCTKRFTNPNSLEKHMLAHSELRPYKCPVEGIHFPQDCGKSFKRREHLAKHKMTHTGDKPYVCPHPGCGRDFVEPGNLNRHKRTHTGDRPYVCPFDGCGRAFGQLATLHDHKKIHTGEFRFVCDVEGCRKMFHKRGNFNRHLATHYDEKRSMVPTAVELQAHDVQRVAARQRSVRDVLLDEAEGYGWSHDQIEAWVAKLEEWGLRTLGSMALDDADIQWPMELAFVRQCLQKRYRHTCLPIGASVVESRRTRFSCGFRRCGQSFDSQEALSQHEARHKAPAVVVGIDTKSKYLCHHCGKVFVERGALRRHLQQCHHEKVERDLWPDEDNMHFFNPHRMQIMPPLNMHQGFHPHLETLHYHAGPPPTEHTPLGVLDVGTSTATYG